MNEVLCDFILPTCNCWEMETEGSLHNNNLHELITGFVLVQFSNENNFTNILHMKYIHYSE